MINRGMVESQENNKELTHASLKKGLMKLYPNSTQIFAEDIKTVFKDKSELLGCRDTVIQDVYNVLLFEIGRRLVDDEKVPEEHRADKQAYDSLPISEAIKTIVKLFKAKRRSFENIFHPEGKFHCFTGSPRKR